MIEQWLVAQYLNQEIERRLIQEQKLLHVSASQYNQTKQSADNNSSSLIQPNILMRFAWIDSDVGNDEPTTATAIGGMMGFDTPSWGQTHLHVMAYTSQNVPLLNPVADSMRNDDFFGSEHKGFTYLAEASLVYETSQIEIEAGRIRIETPYADSDDIRMAPNTFEGVRGLYSLSDAITLHALWLSRWAGYDASPEIARFSPLYEDDARGWGIAAGALEYALNDDTEINLWYYRVDRMADMMYGSFERVSSFENVTIEYGIQTAHMSALHDSGIGGTLSGAMALVEYEALFFSIGANYAWVSQGRSISDGFGGGPYYTSMDESTIASVSQEAPGEDLYSGCIGVGFKLFDTIALEAVHGQMRTDSGNEWRVENNLILSGEYHDHVTFEGVATRYQVKNSSNPEQNPHIDRMVLRVNYSF